MNQVQGYSLIEGNIYAVLFWLGMKFVGWGWFDPGTAADLAGLGVLLASNAYKYWHNRPKAVLDRAGASLPDNTKLQMVATPDASRADVTAARELAATTGDKISNQVVARSS